MLSNIHQENLEEKIKGWKQENPEDLFFFISSSVSPREAMSGSTSDIDGNVEALITQNLLLAHQTDKEMKSCFWILDTRPVHLSSCCSSSSLKCI